MLRFYKKNEEPEQKDFSAKTKLAQKIIKGAKNAKEAVKKTAWDLQLNPRGTIKEGMAKVAENPITMTSQIAATPLHVATAGTLGPAAQVVTAALPNSVPYVMGEAALKKHSKGYAKFTKKAGESVRKSKTVDALLGKNPEVTVANSGPNASFKEKAKYNLRSGLADISNGVQAAGKSIARMAQFSETEEQKNYTIQEGHYTGPKDMEKVPGTIEVLGKATIGGSGIGAVTGGLLKEIGNIENTGILDGAKKGGKIGFFTGIAIKALLNHLHKPMSKVKYQEVDRHLRKEFGMFRVAGLTIGDTREKRKTYDEKFGTNDRDVTKYPINICVNNNQVTMYTLNLSDELLDKLNQSLDYYCKKYAGMEYSSRVINSRTNTYSVNITFTNYDAISSFIMEISEVLGVRINLLNNEILPETKIGKSETHDEEESRVYSNIPSFSRYDIGQIFSKAGAASISALALAGPKVGFAVLVHQTLSAALNRFGAKEVVRLIGGKRKDFDNDFLLYELGRLRYIEGFHYTVGEEKSDINISMMCGKVIITTTTGSKPDLLMTKILGNIDYKKTEVNGKANLWTFLIQDKGSFDIFLKTLIGYVKPNIFK